MLGKHSTTELHPSPSLFPLRQSFPVQSRLALNPRSLMTQPSCGWFMNTQGHDMPDSSSLIWADKLLNSQQPITITLVRVPGCPELWLTGSQWPCSSQGCNGRLRVLAGFLSSDEMVKPSFLSHCLSICPTKERSH